MAKTKWTWENLYEALEGKGVNISDDELISSVEDMDIEDIKEAVTSFLLNLAWLSNSQS